ncbi:MAG: cytochrome c5 family protein [Gammaproteobacteria bacterium]|nr:cytochrome c5 family protein [Gammaproteobacteria bacterium]
MSQTNEDYFTKMVISIIFYTIVAVAVVAGIMWLASIVGGTKYVAGGVKVSDAIQKEAVTIRIQALETISLVGDKKADAATPAAETKAEPVMLDGETIVKNSCLACHGTGVLNAPLIGKVEAWQPRLDANGGIDGLVSSAVAGKGAMPAKGGNPNLTAENLKAAIEFMMK